MNDNLYFYVNRELKYWGGTTGVMDRNLDGGNDDQPNQWDEGDEVLKWCEGCYDIDDSAWCIPAFDLTLSGFIFGQENSIDILVEDFCLGGGQPHAGGMSRLTTMMA